MDPAPKLKDSYQTLGIGPGASLEEIRTAYHRLARSLHPDLNPGALHTHMAHLNAAYQRLRQHLRAKAPSPASPQPSPPVRAQAALSPQTGQEPAPPRNELSLDGPLPLVSDPPSGWRLTGLTRRGGRLVYVVEVVGRPRSLTLPVRRPRTCRQCQGSGEYQSRGQRCPCPGCAGTGRITRADLITVRLPGGWQPGQIVEAPAESGRSSLLVELNPLAARKAI